MSSWYFPVLWATIIGGLVPGVYFAVTFRPRWRRLVAGIDAGGLAIVVVLLYLRSAAAVLSGVAQPDLGTAAINLSFALVVDALLWIRAVVWWQMRRKTRGHPHRRATD